MVQVVDVVTVVVERIASGGVAFDAVAVAVEGVLEREQGVVVVFVAVGARTTSGVLLLLLLHLSPFVDFRLFGELIMEQHVFHGL